MVTEGGWQEHPHCGGWHWCWPLRKQPSGKQHVGGHVVSRVVQEEHHLLLKHICQYSRRFKKNQQIVDIVFYYPEFHTRDDLALIRQNKRQKITIGYKLLSDYKLVKSSVPKRKIVYITNIKCNDLKEILLWMGPTSKLGLMSVIWLTQFASETGG